METVLDNCGECNGITVEDLEGHSPVALASLTWTILSYTTMLPMSLTSVATIANISPTIKTP